MAVRTQTQTRQRTREASNNDARHGRIVKALSGYYYVRPSGAPSDAVVIQCRARGIFKKRGESPLVGDMVDFEETENGEGAVNAIHPRSSELIRPPVANVNLAVLVFSVTEPALNLQLLDKFLVHIEHAGIEAVLCLSKQDLAENGEDTADARRAMSDVRRIYEPIGYDVLVTSSKQGEGTSELKERLQGHLAVFAGQSGVGKSSLLNALVPGLTLETNEISNRLGRGKHTTRHVELIDIGGGFVADTPGFSQLDFTELGIEELGTCFKEMRELSSSCKFRGCTHIHEPECAVLEALGKGEIAPSRHANYVLFMAEMKEKKRRY
ncbi:ribosome small subunit-dependent GTPase A [Paenibacillus sacheonensis]|uniref:Small ribosomal subunit biogenesis GTPase RsgA n=1 Tax=Paenibacillus sacheonensis TaxID=742054 RepID=A0A7X4YRJ0_9BACL|nr:ribosome small subunit-dependent GTPase A [Paenibacillus sacheonensis]MBM7563503.1 ribosome biogenesis GTPase [Paenibacillus sacheonensis]NBC71198.1 ribosome small subunit-dependent GTPase A [Paenibacillus sacheonensis]